jgi:hypothetical protein
MTEGTGAPAGAHRVIYQHIPHPRIFERRKHKPVKVADMATGINGRIALVITAVVGTMWCAYAFAVLALVVLPQATSSPLLLVQWISQTFIQLVMLSILMVGQNIQGRAADKRAQDTYSDAEAILHECLQLQTHLQAQDQVLDDLVSRMGKVAPQGA